MLNDADVDALLAGRHADPFGRLGLHADDNGRLWVRVLLPGADEVALLDAASGKRIVELERRRDSLWEAQVPRRKHRFDYRLAVRWSGGGEGTYADPYNFFPQLGDDELKAFAEGRNFRPWLSLGAHVVQYGDVSGVRFAVWAPNAKRVSVVGSFNNWDGRRHPMRLRHQSGVWEIFVPHAGAGDLYKFEIVNGNGALLPLKADPYARQAQLRPDTASIVAPLPEVTPLPRQRERANRRESAISVYEVHAASWRRGVSGEFPTWDELAEHLPAYAADLGFTHLQLMPISEHPFDGSWGYQTLGMYAPSARFGPPEGFARLVKAVHNQGLGLLLDWVPAHFPVDTFGLAEFDGTRLYEYADPKEGFHRDWNTLIYNFGRTEVREFLIGSAIYWIERWGVDGLRVDAVASMLYRDYSRPAGEWLPNVRGGRENLEAISLLREMNEHVGEVEGAISVAEESTSFPGVSAPTYAGGLGFHYKWNMGWMNDTLRYMAEDPINRRWHHDKMTFGLIYAFSENFMLPISHDEVVHGKGSMLAKMPGDDWQKFANLRAYYGFMWGHPGKKLLFMGQEFAQRQEWNHAESLPWGLLEDDRHAGVQRLVRDLNKLYRDHSALHRLDCESGGFEWISAHDAEHSIYAWVRRDGTGRMVVVVVNMTPVPREGYSLGVPDGVTAWKEALNTDSAYYGGSNMGNGVAASGLPVQAQPAHGRRLSITVTLPPLATVFFVPI